jgi:hypothetical protein
MTASSLPTYETVMGVLGILIAPLWLYLIWRSLRSGVTWGWPKGPKRDQRPGFFWLCMILYFGLAVAFAWHGFGRL